MNVQPIEKPQSKREAPKAESSQEDLNHRPTVAPKVYARKTTRKVAAVESDPEPEPVAISKIDKKISKSKTTSTSKKDDLGEGELSNRLAATKISTEVVESRPKRTTRSTRK